jgi:hypothetical protein
MTPSALIMRARTLEVLRPLWVTQAQLAQSDTAPAADLHLGSRVVRIRLADLALPDTAFPHLTPAPAIGPPGQVYGPGGRKSRGTARAIP